MNFYVPPEYMLPTESKVWHLLHMMKERDKQTYLHSVSVASLAYHIAEGVPEVDKHLVYCSGLLHDIGKLFIPHNILYKAEALTDAEFDTIKKHVDYGVKLLSDDAAFAAYLPIVAHHHEREDGAGYPNRVAGDKIPIESKIISIADTFDAITGHRVYRAQGSVEYALREIKNNGGSQFDKHLVEILIDYINKQQPSVAL